MTANSDSRVILGGDTSKVDAGLYWRLSVFSRFEEPSNCSKIDREAACRSTRFLGQSYSEVDREVGRKATTMSQHEDHTPAVGEISQAAHPKSQPRTDATVVLSSSSLRELFPHLTGGLDQAAMETKLELCRTWRDANYKRRDGNDNQ